jgi:hypothetical protein
MLLSGLLAVFPELLLVVCIVQNDPTLHIRFMQFRVTPRVQLPLYRIFLQRCLGKNAG